MARPIAVGRDVDVRCTKCKMVLAHTILAMVNGVPARVKCNTCHSDRKYRSPTAKKAATTTRKTPAKKSADKARDSRKASAFEKESTYDGLIAAARAKGTEAKPYNMREKWETNALMAHKKFGNGVVTGAAGAGKIRVCFRDGERILVHER